MKIITTNPKINNILKQCNCFNADEVDELIVELDELWEKKNIEDTFDEEYELHKMEDSAQTDIDYFIDLNK
jgi:hypothetical protein